MNEEVIVRHKLVCMRSLYYLQVLPRIYLSLIVLVKHLFIKWYVSPVPKNYNNYTSTVPIQIFRLYNIFFIFSEPQVPNHKHFLRIVFLLKGWQCVDHIGSVHDKTTTHCYQLFRHVTSCSRLDSGSFCNASCSR